MQLGRVRSRLFVALLLALAVSLPGFAANEPPRDAVVVELSRPSEELSRVLELFSKTKAGHPAAALASWKKARPDDPSVGKATEALFAVLNPEMVAELEGLEALRGAIALGEEPRRARWRMVLPRDDGAFEAFATALALTDGRSLEPLRGLPVRQLGKQGGAFAAADGRRVVFASDLDSLETAIDLLNTPAPTAAKAPGFHFRIDPDRLAPSTSLIAQRARAALLGLGARAIEGRLHVEADSVEADWTTALSPETPENRETIELAWLHGLPADDALAAFAVPLATDTKSLDRLFAMADRIEKADPAFRDVAPLRLRLNLLAATRGVRPETDIWPKLRGLSAVLNAQGPGRSRQAVIGLHARDAAAAEALATSTLPKLLRYQPGIRAGVLGGQPIAFEQRDATVWIGYGEGQLKRSIESLANTSPSVGGVVQSQIIGTPPSRLAAVWAGNLPQILEREDPLARSLAKSPPIVWRSDSDGTTVRDRLIWGNLRDTLQRWLDAVPMAPPSGPGAAR